MRTTVITAFAVLALVVAAAAGAVGPYQIGAIDGPPGVAGANGVSYATELNGAKTTLTASRAGKVLRRAVLPNAWGIPVVTVDGTLGGLSHDGRTLVLGSPTFQPGTLRDSTRFAVVDTRTLALRRTIALKGDFGYDALAPDAHTLYLIQHLSATHPDRYQVRAYDLRTWQLDKTVIADRVENEWVMNGQPVARATSANGRFVYTFYSQATGEPFVHALDTVTRTARCIDVPWPASAPAADADTALVTLSPSGRILTITGAAGYGTRLELNTKTLRFARSAAA
jgi:hypothetical protein